MQPPSQQELEQSVVGVWCEEFDYKDVTEDGKAFNRALIVVEAKADHTGYVALAVFDDEFNEPLKVYGGPKDAPFTWQVTAEGDINLKDARTDTPQTSAPHRRSGENHTGFVDVGQIKMSCAQGGIAFSNASHNGSLAKAQGTTNDLIGDWMAKSTLPPACITDSIPVAIFPDYMNYVFTYPSVDPFGNPCTLSGTITVDKSLIQNNEPFHGIMLYNHFTIYATSQAPSRGAIEFPTGAALTRYRVPDGSSPHALHRGGTRLLRLRRHREGATGLLHIAGQRACCAGCLSCGQAIDRRPGGKEGRRLHRCRIFGGWTDHDGGAA